MAFLFFLLYLTVIYLRPGEWVPGLAGWQLLDITTIGTAFFLALQAALTKRGLVRVPHNRMMLGLFAAILASHLVHTYVSGFAGALVGFSKTVIMYFLVVNALNSPRKMQVTLWLLAGLTLLMALQGIEQAKTGVGLAGQGLSGDGRITWVGIFEDPNDLALAFVIVVPILLGYLFGPAFFAFKWILAFPMGILLYGTYLTNSRGGVLALMVAVAFFFIKRSRWRVVGGMVGGLLAAAVFAFGPSRLGMLSADEDSAAGRLDAWYYGFQLLKHNPVFGVGQNMFTEDYPRTAHNSFVLAFAELGLVGFFFWVGLLYVTFKGLSLVQKQDAKLASYAYGLQAGLVGFSTAAFFLSRTYIMMPYLLAGLSAALFNIARAETQALAFSFTGKDLRNVALLCFGVLALLQVGMKLWL